MIDSETSPAPNIPSTRINKKAIKAWRISAAIYALVCFIPSVIYLALAINYSFNKAVPWHYTIDWILFFGITLVSVGVYFTVVIVFPKLRWQRWRYDVSEKEIDLLRGLIIQKRTLIPINRIQHVDTRQGPVYRSFNLSSVTISTAATTHEIPALDDETAAELRNIISALVRKVKEDV